MLSAIIPSLCRRKILSLFFLNPEKEFYLRQISKLEQLPVRSVQLEIQNLCDSGIVLERRSANRRLFHLNKMFFYYKELNHLVLKTMGLQIEVEKHLKNFADFVKYAVVYSGYQAVTEPGMKVSVTLFGSFETLPDLLKEKLLAIKTQLPFQVTFHLKEMAPNFRGIEDMRDPELPNPIVIYPQHKK